MEDGEFHFVLKDENGKTVGEGTNDKDGNISFPALTFMNVVTYNYTVEEVAGNDSHITYDATPYSGRNIEGNLEERNRCDSVQEHLHGGSDGCGSERGKEDYRRKSGEGQHLPLHPHRQRQCADAGRKQG